jgi:DNA-binding HxlR family transcriptional regulator
MPRISKNNQGRLMAEILGLLFEKHPEFTSTRQLALDMIRTDEFVLQLLKNLEMKGLVSHIRYGQGRGAKREWRITPNGKHLYEGKLAAEKGGGDAGEIVDERAPTRMTIPKDDKDDFENDTPEPSEPA